MQIRAVGYTRYSSDNQREESIEAQWRAISEYCQKTGYLLLENYADDAKSATSDARPSFQRMISDAKQKKFDVIVVHKLDRFARDRYDSAYYKRELRTAQIRLESILEPMDDSPESVILESVLEGMAEYYSKNLARETRKGLKENALTGRHTGGRPPYGYRVNPDTLMLEIDERTAPAVKKYFEDVAEGKSLREIADSLNHLGYRTYTGRQFTKNSFWDWSSNKKYMGTFTWDVRDQKIGNGKRNNHKRRDESKQIQVKNMIPPIVSKELWEKVNSIQLQRKQKPGQMKAKVNYLLTDRISCSVCGRSYRGSTYYSTRSNKRYSYYKCSGNCGNKQIDKDSLESSVIQEVATMCFSSDAMQRIADRVKTLFIEERRRGQDEQEPIRKELSELNKKIDRWLDLVGDGVISKQVIAEKLNASSQRKIMLESELERIVATSAIDQLNDTTIFKILNNKKDQLLSDNESSKKLVLQELVDQVLISHNTTLDEYHIDLTVRLLHGVEDGT